MFLLYYTKFAGENYHVKLCKFFNNLTNYLYVSLD